MFRTVALGVALAVAAGMAVAAEDAAAPSVEQVVAGAMAKYKAGRIQEAIQGLQQAIELMQKAQQGGLAAFFPAAPEGWTAGQVESSSYSIGSGEEASSMTQVQRTYTRTGDEAAMTLTMTLAPQQIEMHQAQKAAYTNPEMLKMLNQNPDVTFEIVDRDGWFGWIITEKDQSSAASISSGHCLLSMQLGKGEAAAAKAFLNAMDLKGLGKATAPAEPKPE